MKRKDIVETYEQYNSEKKILEDTNNYISYVAPTSYGKSSIINELIVNEGYNRIGIIVPTKSLINQTYRKIKKNKTLKRGEADMKFIRGIYSVQLM